MAFIEANAEKLIGEIHGSNCPRWFAIVFPAMVEMAQTSGLEIIFPDRKKRVVMDIFYKRERILERCLFFFPISPEIKFEQNVLLAAILMSS